MKSKIIIAAVGGFAAAVNKHIAREELAVRVDAVTLVGDRVSASLVTTTAGKAHSGSLVEIQTASGTADAVTQAFSKLHASNPYWSVVATSPMQKDDPDGDGPKKAPAPKVFAVFACVQP